MHSMNRYVHLTIEYRMAVEHFGTKQCSFLVKLYNEVCYTAISFYTTTNEAQHLEYDDGDFDLKDFTGF